MFSPICGAKYKLEEAGELKIFWALCMFTQQIKYRHILVLWLQRDDFTFGAPLSHTVKAV